MCELWCFQWWLEFHSCYGLSKKFETFFHPIFKGIYRDNLHRENKESLNPLPTYKETALRAHARQSAFHPLNLPSYLVGKILLDWILPSRDIFAKKMNNNFKMMIF